MLEVGQIAATAVDHDYLWFGGQFHMTKETIIRIVKSEPSGLCTKCEKDGCGLWSHKNITYVGNNNNKNLILKCIDQNNMYD